MACKYCLRNEMFLRILILLFASSISVYSNNVAAGGEYVLTLDHTNFSQAISDHNFLVLQFWAPCEKMNRLLCKFGEELAPEYGKAASMLITHEPPIVIAKIDGSAEENKELCHQFEITGYPTIVILQNGGRDFHYYAGPRDADGIVRSLERLIAPPSIEIKTATYALSLINEEKLSIVTSVNLFSYQPYNIGIFPIFSGEEFENFTAIANKLLWESWDYDIFHTSDASFLPRGESLVTMPTLRLLKPYDELIADTQNFEVLALENFIFEASFPLVRILNNNIPDKITQLLSQLPDEEVMLFVDFDDEDFDIFKNKYHNFAALYKCKGIRFVLANAVTNGDVLEYYGLRFDQLPLIIIHSNNGTAYMKPNLKPEDIAPWLKEYKEGKLKAFLKSEPIPVTNDEPLKVVVTDSLEGMVLNSKKNVLLDINIPNCREFRKFAPFIPEVAVLFENDDDIMIASLDGTTNDIPYDTFDVSDCQTLYFKSANGTLLPCEGNETKEDIISFIRNNRSIQKSEHILPGPYPGHPNQSLLIEQ